MRAASASLRCPRRAALGEREGQVVLRGEVLSERATHGPAVLQRDGRGAGVADAQRQRAGLVEGVEGVAEAAHLRQRGAAVEERDGLAATVAGALVARRRVAVEAQRPVEVGALLQQHVRERMRGAGLQPRVVDAQRGAHRGGGALSGLGDAAAVGVEQRELHGGGGSPARSRGGERLGRSAGALGEGDVVDHARVVAPAPLHLGAGRVVHRGGELVEEREALALQGAVAGELEGGVSGGERSPAGLGASGEREHPGGRARRRRGSLPAPRRARPRRTTPARLARGARRAASGDRAPRG
ncbi:MAG: hypothetical protein IPN17_37175 [Deltaproteobacteria bacterium]|nr:hypothetical protein [Deltaproteobacteria bacterium]